MPAWKRASGVVLFIFGEGGTAVWGALALVAWVGALCRGDGVIETDNFTLGLPLLGCGLCAVGPELVIPPVVAKWSDTRKTWFAGVVLGLVLAGLVLVFLGQIVIAAVMEVEVYRACDSGRAGGSRP